VKIGSERLGPKDQLRLSQLNSEERSPLKYPAEPVSVSTGRTKPWRRRSLALDEASWRSGLGHVRATLQQLRVAVPREFAAAADSNSDRPRRQILNTGRISLDQ